MVRQIVMLEIVYDDKAGADFVTVDDPANWPWAQMLDMADDEYITVIGFDKVTKHEE